MATIFPGLNMWKNLWYAKVYKLNHLKCLLYVALCHLNDLPIDIISIEQHVSEDLLLTITLRSLLTKTAV